MIDKEIIKIASNTENHGELDNHTHYSKLKNAIWLLKKKSNFSEKFTIL